MNKLILILLAVIGLTACNNSSAANQLPNTLRHIGEIKVGDWTYADIFQSTVTSNCYLIFFLSGNRGGFSQVDCRDFIPNTKRELNK